MFLERNKKNHTYIMLWVVCRRFSLSLPPLVFLYREREARDKEWEEKKAAKKKEEEKEKRRREKGKAGEGSDQVCCGRHFRFWGSLHCCIGARVDCFFKSKVWMSQP